MSHQAQPLNEEYVAGHVGRLRQLNGLDSSAQLLAYLGRRTKESHKKWHPKAVHRLLSNFTGIDPEYYVGRHSLLPFVRIAATQKSGLDNFDVVASARAHTILIPARKRAYFCIKCVRKDQESQGFSYWRRMHQLPGVDWCEEHGVPLSFVTNDKAFECTPYTWARRSQQVDNHLAELARVHPVVKRYYYITARFLSEARRVSSFAASACLSARAQYLGLWASDRWHHPRLSDYLVREFPRNWMKEHFPQLLTKKEGAPYFAVDGACRSVLSHGQVYAMALAALFEDPKIAMMDFFLDLNSRITAAKVDRKMEKNNRERIDLLGSYIRNNGNHSSMSRELHIDLAYLNVKMRRLGLPSLYGLGEGKKTKVLDFLRNGSIDKVHTWAESMSNRLKWDQKAIFSSDVWAPEGILCGK